MCNWLTWRYVCRKTHYFPTPPRPPRRSITNQFGSKPSSGGRLREELRLESRAPGVRNKNQRKREADRKKLQCGRDETDDVSLKTAFNLWWNSSCWRKTCWWRDLGFDQSALLSFWRNFYVLISTSGLAHTVNRLWQWRQAAEGKKVIREIVERKQKEERA